MCHAHARDRSQSTTRRLQGIKVQNPKPDQGKEENSLGKKSGEIQERERNKVYYNWGEKRKQELNQNRSIKKRWKNV